MRTLSLLVLLATISAASASSLVRVYPVATVKSIDAATTAITTPSGLSVYVNCEKRTFDDSTHDWVSGFSTKAECERFVQEARNGAKNGAEIELSDRGLFLRVTQ